jgi:hypothetical protein
MSTYTDVTKQIGDQWVAALERAQDAISDHADLGQRYASGVEVDYSQIPVPEAVAKFNEAIRQQLDEAIGDQFPKPSEIVEANFELAQRLMTAQRDLTLRLLDASASASDKPKRKKAAAKS